MRYSLSLCALVAPVVVLAAPARYFPRQGSGAASLDITVLQFADVLEQAESTFYQQALTKFQDSDFQAAGFSNANLAAEQFKNIQSDESTHAGALESTLKALGAQPIQGCQFDFSSALGDVATMAATARVVENLGVAAYLGAAPLVSDPVILDAAASILTVEARHSTVLNIFSGTGTAIPQAFDIPFTPSEVLAVAGPFISGCDTGIPANTPLTITTQGQVGPGTKLDFKADSITGDTSNLFCQMLLGGAPVAVSLPFDNCVVPDQVNGPVAIFITNDQTPLINNVRDRNAQQVIAGPTLTFIDTIPEQLGALTRTGQSSSSGSSSSGDSSNSGSSNSGGESISTTTLTPDQASSVIAQASSTAGATDGASPPAATAGAGASSGAVNGAAAGPVLATGQAPNGVVTVNGWNFVNGQGPNNAAGAPPSAPAAPVAAPAPAVSAGPITPPASN